MCKQTCIAKHLVFDDDVVCVKCFRVHFIARVLVRKVEKNLKIVT